MRKEIKVKITFDPVYDIVKVYDPEDGWTPDNPEKYALEVARERFKDKLGDGDYFEHNRGVRFEIVE